MQKNEAQKHSTYCELYFVLFHFDTLSGCKDTNTEALLSKTPTYIHYWLDITLILRHNPIPLPL